MLEFVAIPCVFPDAKASVFPSRKIWFQICSTSQTVTGRHKKAFIREIFRLWPQGTATSSALLPTLFQGGYLFHFLDDVHKACAAIGQEGADRVLSEASTDDAHAVAEELPSRTERG